MRTAQRILGVLRRLPPAGGLGAQPGTCHARPRAPHGPRPGARREGSAGCVLRCPLPGSSSRLRATQTSHKTQIDLHVASQQVGQALASQFTQQTPQASPLLKQLGCMFPIGHLSGSRPQQHVRITWEL